MTGCLTAAELACWLLVARGRRPIERARTPSAATVPPEARTAAASAAATTVPDARAAPRLGG